MKSSAVAAPIPLVPPVMSAVFPSRRFTMVIPSPNSDSIMLLWNENQKSWCLIVNKHFVKKSGGGICLLQCIRRESGLWRT